jgi:hypothetical protein
MVVMTSIWNQIFEWIVPRSDILCKKELRLGNGSCSLPKINYRVPRTLISRLIFKY